MSQRIILSNKIRKRKPQLNRSTSKPRSKRLHHRSYSCLKVYGNPKASNSTTPKSSKDLLKSHIRLQNLTEPFSPPQFSLSQNLNSLPSHPQTHTQFLQYQHLFQKLIQQNSTYGFLLKKLKTVYQEYFDEKSSKLSSRISELKQQLKQERLIYKTIKEFHQAKIQLIKQKKREKKHIRLLNELTQRGYPVSQVYEKLVKNKGVGSSSSTTQSSRRELSKQTVPILALPQNPSCFQQEFMENFNEFSQSWQEQIRYQNR